MVLAITNFDKDFDNLAMNLLLLLFFKEISFSINIDFPLEIL